MITVVVGHRGTGKTELMQRLQLYVGLDVAEFIDLDQEIEKKIGRTIQEMFFDHGEDYFRGLEKQVFLELLQKPHKEIFIVVGAGFSPHNIPEQVRVLWVQRATDLDGRIFLNRPRLNPELDPLEEYKKRAFEREGKFRDRADEIYLMPEGIFENHHQAMLIEKKILLHQLSAVGGVLTITSDVLRTEQRWSLFKDRYQKKGITYFEIRDDFLTFEQSLRILQELPYEHFIFSFRKVSDFENIWSKEELIEILARVAWVDWPWELGPPDAILKHVPKGKIILSLHNASSFQEWQKYQGEVGHLKYAPEVKNFQELAEGHYWQQAQPTSHSFLPRSSTGRWSWYRLRQKGYQLINFWREGEGSATDQPSLWSWLMAPEEAEKFAAVLGDPVAHSFTPLEHSDFFFKKGLSIFAVNITREEWGDAIQFLRALGLSYAAVTSPHKEGAAALCQSQSYRALNTLYWQEKSQTWIGTSTDEKGFLELIEGVGMIAPLQKEIFVWGGGGTLEMLKSALPHASYFSARTKRLREDSHEPGSAVPKIVIWAAPRTTEALFPPEAWSPAMVFDLNYKEDSMGREFAQRCGANYQSGLVMFIAQAQEQRIFWNQCEEKA